MESIHTPDPNGNRQCNQRWNHRGETTVMVDDIEWCPICLKEMNPPEGGE